jgi:hypothetical protein
MKTSSIKRMLLISMLLVSVVLVALGMYKLLRKNNNLGSGKGWKCDKSGSCQQNGINGTLGVFNKQSDCQSECKATGFGN